MRKYEDCVMKKLFSRPALLILLGVMMTGFLLILLVQFNPSLGTNAPAADLILRAESNRVVLLIGIVLVLAALVLAVIVARASRMHVPHSEATTGGFATVPFMPAGTESSYALDRKATHSDPTRPVTLPTRPQAPIAYLIGPGGQPVVIQYPDFSIGRHRDNHLVVNEPHVSRRHARIVMQHGHFMLCNLSQIGTLVNSVPVHQATILQGGEQIRIGTVDFRFTLPTQQVISSPTHQPS
jgi:hypothetical protein